MFRLSGNGALRIDLPTGSPSGKPWTIERFFKGLIVKGLFEKYLEKASKRSPELAREIEQRASSFKANGEPLKTH